MTEEEYFYAQEAEALSYEEASAFDRFINEPTYCSTCCGVTYNITIIDDFSQYRQFCENCKTVK